MIHIQQLESFNSQVESINTYFYSQFICWEFYVQDVMFIELEASRICFIVACIWCITYLTIHYTTHFVAILSTHRLSIASFQCQLRRRVVSINFTAVWPGLLSTSTKFSALGEKKVSNRSGPSSSEWGQAIDRVVVCCCKLTAVS